MTINIDNLVESVMDSLNRVPYIKPEDIPNIDLYMDQVTTFMEEKLHSTTRDPINDKIMTKTMINNYAKNNLLPPPEKKKYSKEHIVVLLFIYYFKGFLSINDIHNLLNPLTKGFFKKDDYNLCNIYEEILKLEEGQVNRLKADIQEYFSISENTFKDIPEDDADFLRGFAIICLLSFDIYSKQLLVEKMIDGMMQKKQTPQTNEEP